MEILSRTPGIGDIDIEFERIQIELRDVDFS